MAGLPLSISHIYDSPGNPTMATIIGVFFQLGFKLSRCIDELDLVDSDPAPGEFKFGYFIFFSIRSLIGWLHSLSLIYKKIKYE